MFGGAYSTVEGGVQSLAEDTKKPIIRIKGGRVVKLHTDSEGSCVAKRSRTLRQPATPGLETLGRNSARRVSTGLTPGDYTIRVTVSVEGQLPVAAVRDVEVR